MRSSDSRTGAGCVVDVAACAAPVAVPLIPSISLLLVPLIPVHRKCSRKTSVTEYMFSRVKCAVLLLLLLFVVDVDVASHHDACPCVTGKWLLCFRAASSVMGGQVLVQSPSFSLSLPLSFSLSSDYLVLQLLVFLQVVLARV